MNFQGLRTITLEVKYGAWPCGVCLSFIPSQPRSVLMTHKQQHAHEPMDGWARGPLRPLQLRLQC